jgi:hypothetical protein
LGVTKTIVAAGITAASLTLTGAAVGVTPTAAAHLTRKDYVDTAIAGITTSKEIAFITIDNCDGNILSSPTTVTGFANGSTAFPISLTSLTVNLSYMSSSGTAVWSIVTLSTRKRLSVSAGTWTVTQVSGSSGTGVFYVAVRTA